MDEFITATVEFLLATIKRDRPTTWLHAEFPLIRADGMTVFDLVEDAITRGVLLATARHGLSPPTVFQAIADRAADQAFAESTN